MRAYSASDADSPSRLGNNHPDAPHDPAPPGPGAKYPPLVSFPIRGSRFNDHSAEVFVPISWTNEGRQQIVSNFDYSIIARLRPNVTVQQATVDPLNVALVN
jgi:hypothetical protein